ncbi:Dual Specificity Phosphatase 28 [Manis pentadactyla]|nr:Dual Specificity Phosphatase 28 [Manis pentadactyla]
MARAPMRMSGPSTRQPQLEEPCCRGLAPGSGKLNPDARTCTCKRALAAEADLPGSTRAAAAPDLLARAGVTLCVNVSRQQPGPRAPGVAELRVPVFDDPSEDLLAHLEPTCAAMEAAVRAGGACLVYCKNGRSRSAAVCTAYLMRHRSLSLAQAFQPSQRSGLNPAGIQRRVRGFQTCSCRPGCKAT